MTSCFALALEAGRRITAAKTREYLIKGVIEPGQVSLWFGPAGTRRSSSRSAAAKEAAVEEGTQLMAPMENNRIGMVAMAPMRAAR